MDTRTSIVKALESNDFAEAARQLSYAGDDYETFIRKIALVQIYRELKDFEAKLDIQVIFENLIYTLFILQGTAKDEEIMVNHNLRNRLLVIRDKETNKEQAFYDSINACLMLLSDLWPKNEYDEEEGNKYPRCPINFCDVSNEKGVSLSEGYKVHLDTVPRLFNDYGMNKVISPGTHKIISLRDQDHLISKVRLPNPNYVSEALRPINRERMVRRYSDKGETLGYRAGIFLSPLWYLLIPPIKAAPNLLTVLGPLFHPIGLLPIGLLFILASYLATAIALAAIGIYAGKKLGTALAHRKADQIELNQTEYLTPSRINPRIEGIYNNLNNVKNLYKKEEKEEKSEVSVSHHDQPKAQSSSPVEGVFPNRGQLDVAASARTAPIVSNPRFWRSGETKKREDFLKRVEEQSQRAIQQKKLQ